LAEEEKFCFGNGHSRYTRNFVPVLLQRKTSKEEAYAKVITYVIVMI
jgi:hypothetical protein